MNRLGNSAVSGAGLEPDNVLAYAPTTVPIGNNHPRQPQYRTNF